MWVRVSSIVIHWSELRNFNASQASQGTKTSIMACALAEEFLYTYEAYAKGCALPLVAWKAGTS
jgi:hypothetical protein